MCISELELHRCDTGALSEKLFLFTEKQSALSRSQSTSCWLWHDRDTSLQTMTGERPSMFAVQLSECVLSVLDADGPPTSAYVCGTYVMLLVLH